MEAFYPAIFSAVFTGGITAIGVYVAITNRLTKVETKIDTLSSNVEKHNRVIERTFKLEEAVDTLKHYHE